MIHERPQRHHGSSNITPPIGTESVKMGFWFVQRIKQEEEEESLARMVNEFLESETDVAPFPDSPENNPLDDIILSLEKVVGSSTNAEKEAYVSALKYLKQSDSEGKCSSKKGLALSMGMDGYEANLCRSSWISSADCPGGSYEYVEIMAMDDHHQEPKRLIIDTDFRSQFEIARPTQSYSLLITNAIPSIFVGDEAKLKKIISLACKAAENSLTERGLHVPPWRKANYMKSKWLSPRHRVPIAILGRNTQKPWTFGTRTSSSRVGRFFDGDAGTSSTKIVNFWGRERSSAKAVTNCSPPNLIPKRRQLGFSQSNLRCPAVA